MSESWVEKAVEKMYQKLNPKEDLLVDTLEGL